LVAAISLRLWGASVRVLDKAAAEFASSRALGCQARTMEILDALGVADEVVAVSEPVRSSVTYRGSSKIGDLTWIPPDAPFPYTYVFEQSKLETILRRRLSSLGVEVEWGREVTTLSQAERVTVGVADGTAIEADWVIGADGAHSAVRRLAGIPFEGDATGERYFIADVDFRQPPSDANALSWMGAEGPLMLMRMPNNPRRWRIFVDVTDMGERPLPAAREFSQQLLDRRGFGPGTIEVNNVVWDSVYRTQVRQAANYRAGHVFVAGDAGHVFPPFGGQGMNTGMQDAYNLAWKLALVVQGRASDRLLDTYHDERYPIGRQVIGEVEQRRRSFAVRGSVARLLRDLLFGIVLKSRALQAKVARTMSQIEQSYRGLSWLSRQADSKRPAAGDRAPDAPWHGKRLHQAFTPTGFTLLRFGQVVLPDLPGKLPLQRLDVDADATDAPALRRRYGVDANGVVLVRPDGHIGFRGGASDGAGLAAYLEDIAEPQQ
jgi:4,5-epoxidase